MRFSQASKKLFELFEKIKANHAVLNNNDDEKLFLEFFRRNIKAPILLSDTGWLTGTVQSATFATPSTIHKGNLLPDILSIDYNEIFSFPESLLPYLEPLVFIKPPPGSFLTTYRAMPTENWTGDWIEVKGDENPIYINEYALVSSLSTFTDETLNTMGVPLNYTKKAWNVNINSGQYIGQVGQLFWTKTVGSITTSFTTNPTIPTFKGEHEITALDSNTFTAVGDETITEPGEDTIFNENVTRTLNFADADGYSITIKFGATIQDTSITSQVFTYINRYLHWSSLRQAQFNMSKSGNDIIISNFPYEGNGHTLPWSSITLDRNSEGYPITTLVDEISPEDYYSDDDRNDIQKQFSYWKVAEARESDFSSWKMKLSIGAIVLSPAVVDDIDNPTIDVQDDEYTEVGDSYSRTTNNTSEKTKGTYVTEKNDVQYRIILAIKNPFIYQEVRKY